MTSDLLWTNPAGYQRTSRHLQRQYLQILLEHGRPTGCVLDIGCGTGNAIPLLAQYGAFSYIGIDKSEDMLRFARQHKDDTFVFIQDDFVTTKRLNGLQFDHIICAACLHWFYPQHKMAIAKIRTLLRSNGFLHLSTAASFAFLPGEDAVQREVIEEVRARFTPVGPITTFDSRRLNHNGLLDACAGFNINKASTYEEWLSFSTFEDFRDWHTGSGSVVYSQFSPDDQLPAVDLYYSLLYDRYAGRSYRVPYGTTLLTLQRTD